MRRAVRQATACTPLPIDLFFVLPRIGAVNPQLTPTREQAPITTPSFLGIKA